MSVSSVLSFIVFKLVGVKSEVTLPFPPSTYSFKNGKTAVMKSSYPSIKLT
jgi:hypothetical protein